MRKIKSAPANLCDMIHRKKKICSNQINLISQKINQIEERNENNKKQEINHNQKIKEYQEVNDKNQDINDYKEINKNIENNNNNKFKQIPLKKKRISTIHTTIITDTYFEFAKKIQDIDNKYYNGLINNKNKI